MKIDGQGDITAEKLVRNYLLEQILTHQNLLQLSSGPLSGNGEILGGGVESAASSAGTGKIPKLSIGTLSSFVLQQQLELEEKAKMKNLLKEDMVDEEDGEVNVDSEEMNEGRDCDMEGGVDEGDDEDEEEEESGGLDPREKVRRIRLNSTGDTEVVIGNDGSSASKIEDVKLHFVHQLDYATSGVLCIALNSEAAAKGSCLFSQRRVKKKYVAIVNGHVDSAALLKRKVVDPVSVVSSRDGEMGSFGDGGGRFNVSEASFPGTSKGMDIDDVDRAGRVSGMSASTRKRTGLDSSGGEDCERTGNEEGKKKKRVGPISGDSSHTSLNMYDFQIDYPIAPDVSGGSSSSKKILAGFKMCIAGNGDGENPGKDSVTLVKVVKKGYLNLKRYLDCNFRGDENPTCEEKEGGRKSNTSSSSDFVPVTVVHLTPFTGRRHQLRLHLQKIGHPIVGDYNYEKPKYHDTYRMFLKAFYLKLPFRELTSETFIPPPMFFCRQCATNEDDRASGAKPVGDSPKRTKDSKALPEPKCKHTECANGPRHFGGGSGVKISPAQAKYSRSSFHQTYGLLNNKSGNDSGNGKKRSFFVAPFSSSSDVNYKVKREIPSSASPVISVSATTSTVNFKPSAPPFTLQLPPQREGGRRRSSSRVFSPSPTRRRKLSTNSTGSNNADSAGSTLVTPAFDSSNSGVVQRKPFMASDEAKRSFIDDDGQLLVEVCLPTPEFDDIVETDLSIK